MALQATATRPEAWGWHLLGLINPVVVIAGNLLGGPFVHRRSNLHAWHRANA